MYDKQEKSFADHHMLYANKQNLKIITCHKLDD